MGISGVVPGTKAILTDPSGNPTGEVKGPTKPGPETKKPNASLYCELIH